MGEFTILCGGGKFMLYYIRVLPFRSTFGRSTGHNSISSIGSTNISEGSIRSTNSIAEKFNKIYQG